MRNHATQLLLSQAPVNTRVFVRLLFWLMEACGHVGGNAVWAKRITLNIKIAENGGDFFHPNVALHLQLSQIRRQLCEHSPP